MVKEKTYTSLHNHTEYSNLRLLDCVNKVEDIIQYAYDIGLNGMAITDHESLSAHIKAIQFYNKQKKNNPDWENFKLILGNEIYLCRNDLTSKHMKGGKISPLYIISKRSRGT